MNMTLCDAYSQRALDRIFLHFWKYVYPPALRSPVPIYTLERSTVRVEYLAQEHNTMSPARARTRTARSAERQVRQP